MSVTRTPFVTVLRTGQLIHLDWASNALDEADIPFQRREETSGGMSMAMSATPATGPGQWWSILVPDSSADQAREVLAALPIEHTLTPGIWSFQPTAPVKFGWKLLSWVALAGIAFSLFLSLVGAW